MTAPALQLDIPEEADAHRWLAGGDGSLAGVIAQTRSRAGAVRWRLAVSADNVYRLEGLYRLSGEFGAQLRLELAPRVQIDATGREFLADFIRFVLCEDGSRPRDLHREDRSLLRRIGAGEESGPGARILLLARVLYLGFRALVRESLIAGGPRPAGSAAMESPVLIGAYGGEHIGDAAILGGVLLGLHERHGTRRVRLASFRPSHTARLVQELDVPVEVQVFRYQQRLAEQQLRRADGLVFAGGPLMDLPNLLVRHWNMAVEARRLGLPFVMDRIGVGPFAHRPSRYAARRIARLATAISVRTAVAARQPELRGLAVETDSDPAFTYLESRGRRLPAARECSSRNLQEAGALLQGAEQKFRVGINLRPIRHLWSPRGEATSRQAEAQCLERIAEAVALVAEKIPCRFIFFPMNANHLGGSDLNPAWRLHRLVGERADVRVWQGSPQVDDLLSLLRGLDAVVAMRFHACIFALSQGRPTFGIDYYPFAGGKVENLFEDRSLANDVTRIDTLETRWLVRKLETAARAAGY